MRNMERETLERRVSMYKEKYGEEALITAIKDQEEKYKHFDKNDYIDIMYYDNEEPKHILIVGDILDYSDYIVAKINKKHKITVIKRLNDIYFPMEIYDVEEFI